MHHSTGRKVIHICVFDGEVRIRTLPKNHFINLDDSILRSMINCLGNFMVYPGWPWQKNCGINLWFRNWLQKLGGHGRELITSTWLNSMQKLVHNISSLTVCLNISIAEGFGLSGVSISQKIILLQYLIFSNENGILLGTRFEKSNRLLQSKDASNNDKR